MGTLEDLREMVEKATAPDVPAFYRDLYRNISMDALSPALRTWEEWHALPMVTREDLQSHSADELIFCSPENIDSFSISSGTRGKPPLFTARSMLDGYAYRKEWYDMKGAFLSGIGPAHRARNSYAQNNGEPAPVVALDPNHLKASLALAEAAGITGTYLPVFLAGDVARYFGKSGAAAHVRFVELAGEKIPPSLVRILHGTFRNAALCASWGMSEINASPVGIPCRPLTEHTNAVYHLKENCHIDLVDPDTLAPIPADIGAEGEILLTSCPSSGTFPMIRYRTGDIGRIEGLSCAAHRALSFSIVGRAAGDFLKIPGGMLRSDEVERVLLGIAGISSETFEMHRYPLDDPDRPPYKIVLHIDAPHGADLAALARIVALQLRVGPSYTYEDGVREGRYERLECVPLERSSARKKAVRMVAH